MIRFHVLAESDRHPDQQIKLQVRDRLLEKMSVWLEETETLEETRECLNSHLEELTREAEAAVREAGGTAGVTVEMTRENFPVRVYGQYRFPAGEYETPAGEDRQRRRTQLVVSDLSVPLFSEFAPPGHIPGWRA